MLDSFLGFQKVFAYCAIIGGTLCLVRLILTFIGMGDHHDIDHSGDFDQDHPTSDADFKLLSLQGLSTFLLIFGLFGLAASRTNHLPNIISLAIALAAGSTAVWLISKLFNMFGKLQHAGNIDMSNALGQVGSVYLTITPQEYGKVTLAVQGRLMTVDATPAGNYEIKTGTQVKVTAILFGHILIVEPTQPTT